MIKPTDPTLLSWLDCLAEPIRVRLLHVLEQAELGVAGLCDVLQIPQSTVSRHLKLLTDQGWLHMRRRGTESLYRMAAGELPEGADGLWRLARDQVAGWPALEQDELRLRRRLSQRDPEEFFESEAGRWDALRGELYGAQFSWKVLLELLPAHWVVADLGCGTGWITAELAGQVKRVVGVDRSAEMIRAARRRTAGVKNVQLKRGRLEDLPLASRSCDAALLVLVLEYLDEPAKVVGEMHRILRPGGKAVVLDLLRHNREDFMRQMGQRCMGFSVQQLSGILQAAGFRSARCFPLPPEPKATGPALLLASGLR